MTRVLKGGRRRESEEDVTIEWSQKCNTAVFEGRGKGPWTKEYWQPLGVEKGKEMDSLLESPERNATLLIPLY